MGVYRIRNSTPLLPRVLSQHSVVSIGVVANVSIIIVVRILIVVSETARVLVGVGAHVDMALWTKMTMMVTALTMSVSANAVIKTSGGTATGGTVSAKDGGKGVGMRGGDAGDMGTRMGSDSFIKRLSVGIGDGDGEGGETVDMAMSPFTTTVTGAMKIGPNAIVG